MMKVSIVFLALAGSALAADDRCFFTDTSSCAGTPIYDIDLPGGAASLHEESCKALPTPCDAAALVTWISIHNQSKQSLSGGTTTATVRGSLLNNPSANINDSGRFVSVAGKSLTLCFQTGGQAAKVERVSICPVLPPTPACKNGTRAEGSLCLIPAPIEEMDPQSVVRTLSRATDSLEGAIRQASAPKSEMEADGATRGVIPPQVEPKKSGASKTPPVGPPTSSQP